MDLVKLGEMEYDIILGKDRLSTCHAYVDCHQKRVIFKMKEGPKFTYEGTKNKQNIPIISTVKAIILLRQRCQRLLATVLDKKEVGPMIEDIKIMSEYPNVFSQDLSSLSPDKRD